MPRSVRDLDRSTWFHVTNRGADRQDIFSDDIDRIGFESRLADASDGGTRIHAYALMTNHFHLVVESPDRSLSATMREIQGRHADHYNRRTGRTGPVFGSRFVSVPVVGDEQFLTVCRYTHRNPVAITGERALAAYRWSSLGVYLGRRPAPDWLSTDRLGAMTDAEALLARVLARDPRDRLPASGMPPLRRTTVGELESAIEAVTSGSNGAIDGAALLARTMAIELRCGDPVELAAHFGLRPDSLRTSARRGRVRLHTDERFARLRRRVLEAMDRA